MDNDFNTYLEAKFGTGYVDITGILFSLTILCF